MGLDSLQLPVGQPVLLPTLSPRVLSLFRPPPLEGHVWSGQRRSEVRLLDEASPWAEGLGLTRP